jgi:CheY-like chemotaxis protein
MAVAVGGGHPSVARCETVSAPAEILVAEDLKRSTVGTVGTLRGYGNIVTEARSLDEAWRALKRGTSSCATLDQRMPVDMADEGLEASDEQIDELAREVGRQIPFVWLTAHTVMSYRLDMPGCLGVVTKAGDVTRGVVKLLQPKVPDLQVRNGGMHLDQVLLKLSLTEDPEMLSGVVLAWRPDPFPVRARHLPSWLQLEVKENQRRPVYVKARAWLAAKRPGQLDLCELEHTPQDMVSDQELWDD